MARASRGGGRHGLGRFGWAGRRRVPAGVLEGVEVFSSGGSRGPQGWPPGSRRPSSPHERNTLPARGTPRTSTRKMARKKSAHGQEGGQRADTPQDSWSRGADGYPPNRHLEGIPRGKSENRGCLKAISRPFPVRRIRSSFSPPPDSPVRCVRALPLPSESDLARSPAIYPRVVGAPPGGCSSAWRTGGVRPGTPLRGPRWPLEARGTTAPPWARCVARPEAEPCMASVSPSTTT